MNRSTRNCLIQILQEYQKTFFATLIIIISKKPKAKILEMDIKITQISFESFLME